MIELTPHPDWVLELLATISPYEERIVNHKVFQSIQDQSFSKACFQRALVNFFPLIEYFPQFLAVTLTKVRSNNAWDERTRQWLMGNINQERCHTEWWRNFAESFGVPSARLEIPIEPPAKIAALSHYLWTICTYGSLSEAVSAANFGVEGATGLWTKTISRGIEGYRHLSWTKFDKKTLRWITAHATYDDHHPLEALEIVKAYATTPDEQAAALKATRRALEYYLLALDACYEINGEVSR